MQPVNMSLSSRESLLRPVGIVMKLFLLRFNPTNEDREVRSMGITSSNRLQSLKFNSVKDFKPEKEGNRNGIVSDEKKDKSSFCFLDFAPLHPANDNT